MMSRLRSMTFAALTLGLLAAGSPASAVSVQSEFDAAQAALDAAQWRDARDRFQLLLNRLSKSASLRSVAVVKARLATALMATGEASKSIPLLTQALGVFDPKAPADRDEHVTAMYELGRAYADELAFDDAARAYRAVLGDPAFPAGSAADIGLRTSLAVVLIWSAPAEARALLDGLLALPVSTWGKSKDQLALVNTLRGRIELNNGNPAGARTWFMQSVKLAGGLSTTVNAVDMRVRNDMALAYHLLGNASEMGKYVAYSGAGSLFEEGVKNAADMPLPACEPRSSLSPDDVAVIEFAIADDGRVTGVTPIYASRPGGPEVLFAQAVKSWSWNIEALTKIDAFWRQGIRVELRCTKEVTRRDPVNQSFSALRTAWLTSQGITDTPPRTGSDAALLPVMRTELARRESGHGVHSPHVIPAIEDLAANTAVGEVERKALRERLMSLLAAAAAPVELRAVARVAQITGTSWGPTMAATARNMIPLLRAILGELEAGGAGQSRAASYVRLTDAIQRINMEDLAGGRLILNYLTALPPSALGTDDPIRVAALLRLSNLDAASKDLAGAARHLELSGLSPEQCALIDIRPQPINATITGRDIPLIARTWTTGGTVRTEYDIRSDGTPSGVRTVIGMPPFVYGEATVKSVSRFRFQPVFRPGNDVGCTAASNRVGYKITR